jgi:hypothetical protein
MSALPRNTTNASDPSRAPLSPVWQRKSTKSPNTTPTPTQSVSRSLPVVESAPPTRLITPARILFVVITALLIFGYYFPTDRYISAASGWGYLLGIIGGGLMIVLLLYPLRKRFRWLAFIGTTKRWFQVHMLLGILGPVTILYHANFNWGAANSNVALICMLVVSGSGLFGRHFYSRIHDGLYGRKETLAELQKHAQRLRYLNNNLALLPLLVREIDAEEASIVNRCEATPTLLRPLVVAWYVLRARIQLYLYVRRTLRTAAVPMSEDDQQRVYRLAANYIENRLAASRRVLEFDSYERLFSLWHMLHMPLFVLLLIAGIAHVIAVHVY